MRSLPLLLPHLDRTFLSLSPATVRYGRRRRARHQDVDRSPLRQQDVGPRRVGDAGQARRARRGLCTARVRGRRPQVLSAAVREGLCVCPAMSRSCSCRKGSESWLSSASASWSGCAALWGSRSTSALDASSWSRDSLDRSHSAAPRRPWLASPPASPERRSSLLLVGSPRSSAPPRPRLWAAPAPAQPTRTSRTSAAPP